jgi:glycerol-3-phosphate acyltransferase PlsX
MTRILLDAMGGDEGPIPNVRGALNAIAKHSDIEVILVGHREKLEELLQRERKAVERIEVVESQGVAGMGEGPVTALKRKRNCSIAKCWELLNSGAAHAIVSAGSTGAVVAASRRWMSNRRRVKRPAVAVSLPSRRGRIVLLDAGANPSARPEHLAQYAVMGDVYAREVLGVPRPRIGLLNVGTEGIKGNLLVRSSHQLIGQSRLGKRYVGYIEGHDVFEGRVDVVVCDGHVGNILLKASEGLSRIITEQVSASLLRTQGKRLAETTKMHLRQQFGCGGFGGAPLLGVGGTCVICHGASDHQSIGNALHLASSLSRCNLHRHIFDELSMAFA